MQFRLKASFDVDNHVCHPIQRVILKTLQPVSGGGRGFCAIVCDKAGDVTFTTESGVPIQQDTGVNPWDGMLAGATPGGVMSGFPWGSLECLPEGYGNPAAS